MGSHREIGTDWIRNNTNRYLSEDTPMDALDAVQHVLAARAALEVGEIEVAEFMYRGAARLWKKMESEDPGHWTKEIESTSREMKNIHHRHH